MTVRIMPRGHPKRTDLYASVASVTCYDGVTLWLHPTNFMGEPGNWIGIPLSEVSEILLDEDPGDWW